jgi:hypothetical protein
MCKTKLLVTVGGVLLMGLAGVTQAASVPDSAQLLKEMTALQERVRELEASQNSAWLNERRAEEVKTLVREVLSDADTRASLMGSALGAGWEDGFYLASEDGGFVLRIDGRIQSRYTHNMRDTVNPVTAGQDENESGFEFPRVNLTFSGQIDSGPIFKYSVGLKTDVDDQEILLDHAWVSHDLGDTLTVKFGEDKGPFLHEELTSASYQLAADRSLMNEIFTAGRIQGVWLLHELAENLHLASSINDGFRSGEADVNAGITLGGKDFHDDDTDIATTGRIDWLVMGGWDQFMDFTAESNDPTAVKIGAAWHSEHGETGDDGAGHDGDFIAWTVDAAFECHGFNLFAALAAINEDADASGVHDQDLYGAVVQGGYRITADLEPFVRYEWIDLDGGNTNTLADDELNILTVGANYYMKKHAAKLTVDVVWAFDPIPGGVDMFGANSDNLGLLADDGTEDEQLVIRAQFQLLF